MSVDVEDWFQVENLKPVVTRASWPEREYRVEFTTRRILSLFADTGVRATFFCLGWVAERSPGLIREIADAGHEVASHGYAHELVYEQSAADFRADVVRARTLLEDVSGLPVGGYRAPSFSITADAARILAETGHTYDSSVFPVGGHDRYSRLDDGALSEPADPAARAVRTWSGSRLWELPITTRELAGLRLPWGGGGYFRMIPAGMFRRGFTESIDRGGGGVFYLHPWEIDPGQPRVEGLRLSHRFRHYVNLARTEGRLRTLCQRVHFGRADEFLAARGCLP